MMDLTTCVRRLLPVLCLAVGLSAVAQPAPRATQPKAADYIVAIINNELVTQVELEQRVQRLREEAQAARTSLPETELRRRALDGLIDERVVVTFARDTGVRVDEAELDRAVSNIASMNKMTPEVLRERLRAEGMEYSRFRATLRDQILADRVREREVGSRIRVSDLEIDAWLAEQRVRQGGEVQLDMAQILISVPEGASPAVQAQRRALMEQALVRLKAGEPFALVAKALSEDGNSANGGEIGLRPISRLPDLFVDAVRDLAVGQVLAQPLRSPAGFHLLKLLARQDSDATVTQTRARHILLRPSARLSSEAAAQRLAEMREQVLSSKRSFEELAQQYSEDGSAPRGGDLGWATPGQFVPEFEQAMNTLAPGGLSQPLVSRFGVHLIQVVDRRQVAQDPQQLREQARAALRERKFDEAYVEWLNELRARTYIEMREPPL